MLKILTLLTAASAYLTVRSEYRGPRKLVYICKPLTIVFIITMAVVIQPLHSGFYKNMILLGLAFSLVGDIFLMLPGDRFRAALASFLVVHFCYIAAFGFNREISLSFVGLVAFLAVAGLVFSILRPNLGNLKLPVFVYVCVISIMAWLAFSRWLSIEHSGSVLALGGALFFLTSDALLAIDRFKRTFHKARFYVLTTYFTAQWLIAFSITGS